MTGTQEMEVFTFSVSDRLCGINILDIQEIIKVAEIRSVPQAPDFVAGITNMRGQIVTVINLGSKLGLTPVERNKENRMLVVAQGRHRIGMIVDDIGAVLPARSQDIEPPPANLNGVQGDLFEGVIQTPSRPVGLLRLQTVLSV